MRKLNILLNTVEPIYFIELSGRYELIYTTLTLIMKKEKKKKSK